MNAFRLSIVLFVLLLSVHPLLAQQFTDSNLPIIQIMTNSQVIESEPKVMVDMTIFYHPDGSRNYLTDAPHYTGKIGIEIRGNSSSGFEKKSYGFETWDAAGQELDTSFINMPKESDWVLYAGHNDKSLMRNVLTYHLYNQIGRYAPRTQFCEVVMDGEYRGVYVLMEKVKRDNDRVDIAKLQPADTAGVDLTGGYILRIDGGFGFSTSNENGTAGGGFPVNFAFYYPSAQELQPQQYDYIANYITSFEDLLYGNDYTNPVTGFRSMADDASFVDYLLLEELAKNADIYVRSTYIVKPKDGEGKLQMGPPWDCDICFGNIQWLGAEHTNGFYYNEAVLNRLSWMQRMMSDTAFADLAKCRWMTLRQQEYSEQQIHQYIDATAQLLDESQQRNFERWPVLNQDIFINVPPFPQSYQEAVDSLKAFVSRRLTWIDNNLPGACPNLETEEAPLNQLSLRVFPNPSKADFYCTVNHSGNETAIITVTDLTGNLVETFEATTLLPGENTLHIVPKKEWKSGVYLLNVTTHSGSTAVRIMR